MGASTILGVLPMLVLINATYSSTVYILGTLFFCAFCHILGTLFLRFFVNVLNQQTKMTVFHCNPQDDDALFFPKKIDDGAWFPNVQVIGG
jgi:hypothetical protein